MSPEEQIRQLLTHGGPSVGLVMLDVLEENGWQPSLVEWTALLMTDPGMAELPAEVMAQVLGALAKNNYPTAVQLLLIIVERREQGMRGNYFRGRYLLVDAINTAHCGDPKQNGRRGTWQERLKLVQVEVVTGEINSDLEPWEGVTDAAGRTTRRPWATDYPPEWMERELHREFGHNASFKTVYYSSGGNFGPSLDELLKDKEGTWNQVRQFQVGEVGCPWDDGGGGVVDLESTYCGDRPGEECNMCGAPLGEAHGVVYLGEMAGAVFMLDVIGQIERVEFEERNGTWYLTAFDKNGDELSLPQDHDTVHDTRAEAEAWCRVTLPSPQNGGPEIVFLENPPD